RPGALPSPEPARRRRRGCRRRVRPGRVRARPAGPGRPDPSRFVTRPGSWLREAAAPLGAQTEHGMGLERIEALLWLLSKHEVSESQVKGADQSIRLRLGPPPVTVLAGAAPASAVAPVAPSSLPGAPAPSAAPTPSGDDGLVVVESPMVGTFYRASSP